MTTHQQKKAEDHIRAVFKLLGHDMTREGLRDTPKRMVKVMLDFSTPRPFNFTTFSAEGCNEMVIQLGIPFVSLCEHHGLPVIGKAVVGYIPDKRIVGLSKLARSVQFYARRYQNQERITRQVAEFLQKELKPKGVGVHLCAEHHCMTIRGVEALGAKTTTICLIGAMKESTATRQEFLAQIPG